MKHPIALFVILCALVGLLAACGGGSDPAAATTAPAATTAAASATTAPASATTVAATDAPAATTAPDPTAVPTATNAPTPTPAPVQPSGDARAQILAAYQKMFARPYRTESLIKADTGDMTLLGEFVPPDRLHSLTTAAGFSSEVIMVGDSGWQRLNGSDWTVMPAVVTGQIAQMQKMAEDTMTSAEALGSETLDGRKVWVYRYTSDFEGVTSTTTVYVDAATGLPVQQEVVGEAAGVASTTVQKISYADDITIAPPIP